MFSMTSDNDAPCIRFKKVADSVDDLLAASVSGCNRQFTRWPRLRLAVEPAQIRWRKRPGLRVIEKLPVVTDPELYTPNHLRPAA
jgi:hypothetical protein